MQPDASLACHAAAPMARARELALSPQLRRRWVCSTAGSTWEGQGCSNSSAGAGGESAAQGPGETQQRQRWFYSVLPALHSAHVQLRRLKSFVSRQQQLVSSSEAGSHGVAWACMGLVLPTLPGAGLGDLLNSVVFMSGFCAWLLAQSGKIFTTRYKTGIWDIRALYQSGGMPSSHSSLCSGITTAVALHEGLGSPLFAACIAFSVIVMYDAMGVRRHAGKQAEVLNQVIVELMATHPVVAKIKLKEVLGHSPRQVMCGALLGVVTGLLYPCLLAAKTSPVLC